MGLLGWFNDLLVLVFTAFLFMTVLAFAYGWQLPVRQLAEWILFVPILSIITGVLRVAWALRLSTGCGWRDGMGAFGAMLAMSWTVACACATALWNDKGTFLRTPKFGCESSLTRALKAPPGRRRWASCWWRQSPWCCLLGLTGKGYCWLGSWPGMRSFTFRRCARH